MIAKCTTPEDAWRFPGFTIACGNPGPMPSAPICARSDRRRKDPRRRPRAPGLGRARLLALRAHNDPSGADNQRNHRWLPRPRGQSGHSGPGVREANIRLAPDQDPQEIEPCSAAHRRADAADRAGDRAPSVGETGRDDRHHPAVRAAAAAYRQGFGAAPYSCAAAAPFRLRIFSSKLWHLHRTDGVCPARRSVACAEREISLPNFFKGIATSSAFLNELAKMAGRRSAGRRRQRLGETRRRHDYRLSLSCRQRRRPDRSLGHGGAAREVYALGRHAGIERTVIFAAFHSDYAIANREVARIVASRPTASMALPLSMPPGIAAGCEIWCRPRSSNMVSSASRCIATTRG